MAVIHNLLIVANAIIISGGSILAGGPDDITDSKLATAKAMRTAGQSVFLAINAFLLYCILDSISQSRRENPGRSIHPTLYILLATWPLLFVRGIYGVLAGVLPAFNYFNPDNYEEHGLSNSYITSEYIMGTTMEWTSCALLMATYLTSRNDPKKGDLVELEHKRTEIEA